MKQAHRLERLAKVVAGCCQELRFGGIGALGLAASAALGLTGTTPLGNLNCELCIAALQSRRSFLDPLFKRGEQAVP